MTKQKPTLVEHFKIIPTHAFIESNYIQLDDIFFITLCAVICGYVSWVAIEKFAKMKLKWSWQYLSLEHGNMMPYIVKPT
ncbi:transposase family protein [Paraglaciecola psychrophila]|uniref:transposase family protein n=1 Tax=Paraglaciecola psychrophila TaxID=326544 RepID=UPI000555EE0F